jgi:hypothetical protein
MQGEHQNLGVFAFNKRDIGDLLGVISSYVLHYAQKQESQHFDFDNIAVATLFA